LGTEGLKGKLLLVGKKKIYMVWNILEETESGLHCA
jgi:hypothetical protein